MKELYNILILVHRECENENEEESVKEKKTKQTNKQTNKWNLLIRNLGSNFDNAIVCCLSIHHVMGFVVPLSDLVHDNEH